MKKNKRLFIDIAAVLIIVVLGYFAFTKNAVKTTEEVIKEVVPVYGNIQVLVTATGKVEPQNRLEIKPPISGRVDEILVHEGDKVIIGQTLAWMSSTDRAALVDAASTGDKDSLKYWQEVYKPAPLIAPIAGEVIVRAVEPGQTVATTTPIIVLSDRLIVNAQFDEVDIGKVKVGQDVLIILDAYPQNTVKGKVDHIAYESKIINNVTMYDVDIVPINYPDYFRSGMSANISVIESSKDNILLIPNEAVIKEGPKSYVWVKTADKPLRREIVTGINDEKNTEVISGLNVDEKVIIKTKKSFLPKKNDTGKNPFLPSRQKKEKKE